MTKTAAPTVYQTAFAEGTAYFQGQPVARLRKLAAGKVKNVSRLPKASLVAELAKLNAQDAEKKADTTKATEKPAKTRSPKTQSRTQTKAAQAASGHETKALGETLSKSARSGDVATRRPDLKKATRKVCQVCDKRPVDRKTQGRDSTMCGPCFEYAGWENTHSDNGHEGQGDLPNAPKELLEEMALCPVCQGQNPADDDVKTKANGSKPGRKVTKPMAVASKSFDAKAKAFAAIAKEAGWKSRVHEVSKTAFQVIATSGSESITMVWDNGAYQYDMSQHKDEKGRKAKIRNASAARKALEA